MVVGEDPDTGKSTREVMKCQLPASSTIHASLPVQGFSKGLVVSYALILPLIALRCPIRNTLRI